MSNLGNPLPRPETSAQGRENYLKFNNSNKKVRQQEAYVKRLPFYQRYPRAFIAGGLFLTVSIVYSAPLYYFFRTPVLEEDEPVWRTKWYSERVTGKTKSEQYWETKTRQEEEYQAMLQKKKEFEERKARTFEAQARAKAMKEAQQAKASA